MGDDPPLSPELFHQEENEGTFNTLDLNHILWKHFANWDPNTSPMSDLK